MSLLARWTRFNLVGIAGALVQLATLGALDHRVPGHYLLATAAALEITLLHNFFWHTRVTWRGRSASGRAFLRFHLSNGLVSLVGNLALMRLLVGARFPVLGANALAICLCSLVNFGLGERWVFQS